MRVPSAACRLPGTCSKQGRGRQQAPGRLPPGPPCWSRQPASLTAPCWGAAAARPAAPRVRRPPPCPTQSCHRRRPCRAARPGGRRRHREACWGSPARCDPAPRRCGRCAAAGWGSRGRCGRARRRCGRCAAAARPCCCPPPACPGLPPARRPGDPAGGGRRRGGRHGGGGAGPGCGCGCGGAAGRCDPGCCPAALPARPAAACRWCWACQPPHGGCCDGGGGHGRVCSTGQQGGGRLGSMGARRCEPNKKRCCPHLPSPLLSSWPSRSCSYLLLSERSCLRGEPRSVRGRSGREGDLLRSRRLSSCLQPRLACDQMPRRWHPRHCTPVDTAAAGTPTCPRPLQQRSTATVPATHTGEEWVAVCGYVRRAGCRTGARCAIRQKEKPSRRSGSSQPPVTRALHDWSTAGTAPDRSAPAPTTGAPPGPPPSMSRYRDDDDRGYSRGGGEGGDRGGGRSEREGGGRGERVSLLVRNLPHDLRWGTVRPRSGLPAPGAAPGGSAWPPARMRAPPHQHPTAAHQHTLGPLRLQARRRALHV